MAYDCCSFVFAVGLLCGFNGYLDSVCCGFGCFATCWVCCLLLWIWVWFCSCSLLTAAFVGFGCCLFGLVCDVAVWASGLQGWWWCCFARLLYAVVVVVIVWLLWLLVVWRILYDWYVSFCFCWLLRFAGCLYFVVAVCWQLPAWLQVRRVLLAAGLGDGAMRLLALVCC